MLTILIRVKPKLKGKAVQGENDMGQITGRLKTELKSDVLIIYQAIISLYQNCSRAKSIEVLKEECEFILHSTNCDLSAS